MGRTRWRRRRGWGFSHSARVGLEKDALRVGWTTTIGLHDPNAQKYKLEFELQVPAKVAAPRMP
jgi:hypothetical protein